MTTYAEYFAQAREMAQAAPSRDTFLSICQVVEQAVSLDMAASREELLPYLSDHLGRWPSRLRMAPLLWINRLIDEALPVEALSIVSGLSLTAALVKDYWNEPTSKLYAWLENLPEDAPALEGLTLSRGQRTVKLLKQAIEKESDPRFHPAASIEYLDVEDVWYWDFDEDHISHLLGSPLTRHLKVLDVSWDAIHKLLDNDEMGQGRHMTLGAVGYRCNSDRLESLDLHGQSVSGFDPVSIYDDDDKKAIARLKRLNLAGNALPVGKKAFNKLFKSCPGLVWLDVRPGTLGSFVFDHDFSMDEDWQYREANLVGVYDMDDVKEGKMTPTTKKKLKAIETCAFDGYSSFANNALWLMYFDD